MTLQAGDVAVSESDGRTKVTLIRDVTDSIEPELPAHQRYWAVERPSGARRLALVHRGERVVEVRDRIKLPFPVREIIDEA